MSRGGQSQLQREAVAAFCQKKIDRDLRAGAYYPEATWFHGSHSFCISTKRGGDGIYVLTAWQGLAKWGVISADDGWVDVGGYEDILTAVDAALEYDKEVGKQ